ncbi:MAG: hypothetical protein Q8S54_18510 [Bacteroidota bacterium]|nr:hypothetical protein [Odoribacter sp.]MDP3645164.1 hypothetical protein [Bacteroidota bacterium]
MNKITLSILILFALINSTIQAQNPEKLRRADCFFGVHFDLHASEDITDAGRTLTPEMVDTFLAKVRPDFIQIDCKGHPGITSYPTKVGYHVKGFQKDPLRVWRDVTEKYKVALFMHYSGVWDGKVCTEHPDWAIVKANGEKSTQKISFFSPYLDELMIPQLKELSSEYHVDGAWIDGECWAVEPDYSEKAIQEWKRRTGFTAVPKGKNDPNYAEYIEYNRSLFRDHMRKYVDAIHAYDPNFQITSNWAYSSLMPEKVEINVDFLSGDVTPQNGVFRSAFEARCLAPQGKPWDLMAWGFSWNGAKMPMSDKSIVQLKQEAAQIISMGGGVQFYFQQNRDLSLKPWLAGKLSDLGTFCRERQAFCHKATAIPQIALLFPTQSYQRNASVPFSASTDKLQATLYALLDNQLPVEVLMEHHLKGKMSQYPLIVIPECDYIDPSMLSELQTYVQNGGNLLVIGTETSGIFARELGIQSANTTDEKTLFISAANCLGGVSSKILSVELGSDSKVISGFYDSNDYRDQSKSVASSIRQVGKGKISGIYFNAGTAYSQYKTPVIRDFIAETISLLSPEKMIEVTGSHLVHVAINKLNRNIYVNLINVAGEHTNQAAIAYDQVPPLTDLTVTIKTPAKPGRIVLQPENKKLDFTYINGKSTVLIPKLEIHSILEVVEQE